ncbi:hypothetical protein [Pseudoalteromonas rubra]|uniref:hypothetical protein n=1 Tax=Pseudoalteromonas rubra TaxID=43658 RepID=UPI000F79EFD6|nr:hypothetical protein [Pseudoalteromonas rubra]
MAASPHVVKFGWEPATVEVGKPASFRWDIRNVRSCTSSVSGEKASRGVIGPLTFSAPGTSVTKWTCTTLDGKRYPTNGYLEAKRTVINPRPYTARFGWEPKEVAQGQSTSFYWDIRNVRSCTSSVSGAKASSGRIGPLKMDTVGQSTSRWFCTDLDGGRYPASGYLESTRTVTPPAPRVVRFEWSPKKLVAGQASTFRWQIENVQGCTSLVSGAQASSGAIGPQVFYQPETSTTRWYCKDLSGKRFPVSGYLEATRNVYPAPVKKQFAWQPETIEVGQKSTFVWNIDNVAGCTSSVSGAQPASGQIGPQSFWNPGTSTTKWTCTDLAGGRYPSDSSKYLSAQRVVRAAVPKKIRFGWEPAEIMPGETSTFYWEFENVESCTSSAAPGETYGPKGSKGPYRFEKYSELESHWRCVDLEGKPFPEEGAFIVKRPVKDTTPRVIQFGWDRKTLTVGEQNTFRWEIANVTRCFSNHSGEQPAKGQIGPATWLSASKQEQYVSTTKWYCLDLFGERFPRNVQEFLSDSVTVRKLAAPAIEQVSHTQN